MFPLFTYAKIAGIAALVAVAGYVSWTLRGAYADKEQEQAVSRAVAEVQEELAKETILREHYTTLADEKLARLLKSISEIRAGQKTISTALSEERKANPAFYNQELPAKGYDEWLRARSLVPSAPASSASAP